MWTCPKCGTLIATWVRPDQCNLADGMHAFDLDVQAVVVRCAACASAVEVAEPPTKEGR